VVAEPTFDPLALLASLDQHRVTYIVIGAFARVVQGAEEITRGLDIVPSPRTENLRRLDAALRDLHATAPDGTEPNIAGREQLQTVAELWTDHGEIKIVPTPVGTAGYDDLRRAATREPLGRGLRPAVASVGDLTRMLSALGRQDDIPNVLAMRRIAELEISRGIDL
jgi:hypothetical protein